jgi:hypothetical protein
MGKQASPLLVAETTVFVTTGVADTLTGAGVVAVCVAVVAGFAGVAAVAVGAVVAGIAGVAAVVADAAGDVELLDELLDPQPLRRVTTQAN